MLNVKKWAVVLLAGVISSVVLLSGCTKKPSISETELTELKAKIEALEAENQLLKANEAASVPLKTEEHKEGVVAGASNKQFTDLDEEMTTTVAINNLTKLGVFDFVEGNEFKPYETITRAEYVKWLFKAHNKLVTDNSNKIQLAPAHDPDFTDIDQSHPHFKYVAALDSAGYSVGYDDKSFKPDQPITREEMIVIKVGVDVGKAVRPDRSQMRYIWGFSDSNEIDERATGYIHKDHYVYNNNINRSFGKIGTFKPKQPVLRHEAAASLSQVGSNAGIYKTTVIHALERLANNGG